MRTQIFTKMGPRLFATFIVFHCYLSVLPQMVFKPVSLEKSALVPRIVNGHPAKLGEVPYQVAFKKYAGRNRYRTFCGGVIIGMKTILTAAHCFSSGMNLFSSDCSGATKKVTRKHLRAYAVAGNLWNQAAHPGQNRWRKTRQAPYGTKIKHSDGQWRALARGVYPNKYNFPKNDIAIIWTRKHFEFNDYVVSIPIATVHMEYTSCLASGYGRKSGNANIQTTVLLLAYLDIIPTSYCSRMHKRNMFHFVCTSTTISDVAQGDSGGPLVCKNTLDPNDNGTGVVAGIVSGARVGVGSFFTRVSSFRKWIEKGGTAIERSSITFLSLAIYATICLF